VALELDWVGTTRLKRLRKKCCGALQKDGASESV